MTGFDLEMMEDMWMDPTGSKNFSILAEKRINFITSKLRNSSDQSLYNLSEFLRLYSVLENF